MFRPIRITIEEFNVIKLEATKALKMIGISTVNQLDAAVSQIYLFSINTLHVSDGLSVHHQEFKTVHTATGIYNNNNNNNIY
jgi:hypothetical protein